MKNENCMKLKIRNEIYDDKYENFAWNYEENEND